MASPDIKVRVLVVEDSAETINDINGVFTALKKQGMDWVVVAYAASVEEATNLLNRQGDEPEFTHVFLDGTLKTSRWDGLSVAKQILERFPHTVLFGISSSEQGLMSPDNRVATHDGYVDYYLGKVFYEDEVVQAISATANIQKNR